MNTLIKPHRLLVGDTIATVSPSNGLAGDPAARWKYDLGKKRLEDLYGLKVLAAPNSMRGSEYLEQNPQARAEDMMWAFENKNVKAIIANMGGWDSVKLLPFIDPATITNNPKILIGYSDTMVMHLLCYKAGLSTFYGHNMLYTIAEAHAFHPYSEYWFRKTLFDPSPIGLIQPSADWAYHCRDYENEDYNPNYKREYIPNVGCELVQGSGVVTGRLVGGHDGFIDLDDTSIALSHADFENSIFFYEDIPEFFSPKQIEEVFTWLGNKGFLQKMNGIIIGKMCENGSFDQRGEVIRGVCKDFGCSQLPIVYGLNFGHTAPMFVLPYGATAEINCEDMTFSILESGVV